MTGLKQIFLLNAGNNLFISFILERVAGSYPYNVLDHCWC